MLARASRLHQPTLQMRVSETRGTFSEAIKSGRTRENLLAMLRRRRTGGKALDTLPECVQGLLDEPDVLLANNQKAAGRSTLAALGAEITLAPNDTGPTVHALG
jgi:hypothetical protein